MFAGLHVILAQRLDVPEIAITDEQGRQFMSAAANVLRHYSVEATQKTLDWIAFASVAGTMYGTMAVGIIARKKAERKRESDPFSHLQQPATPSQPQEQAPNVVHVPSMLRSGGTKVTKDDPYAFLHG